MWHPPGAPDTRPRCLRRWFRGKALASFAKLTGNESGVTAMEYAFIAGLVAIAIVAVVTTLGTSVSGLFGSVIGGF
jgi:pilus assembly protein Flp/PilA